MAGKQNEKVIEAERRYHDGEKLADIARALEVPAGTVRRWKNTYNWDLNDKERSEIVRNKETVRNEKANARKKRTLEKKMSASVEANEELTDKQKLFCVYYAQTLNATQSYIKAYGAEYETALAAGSRLLGNVSVREEIKRLKAIKQEALLLDMGDLVEKQAKIAFADLSDFVEFGRETVPVMGAFGPVMVKDPETGKKIPLTKEVNTIRFKESSEIDASVLQEVKVGRDGASVKLADREKALAWLTEYLKHNGNDDGGVQIIDDL